MAGRFKFTLKYYYHYRIGADYADAQYEWGHIRGGWLTIYEGYSWDGCSPKIRIPFTDMYIGTWDGPKDERGIPACYYASLVHDFLCQYKVGTRLQRDLLFRRMLCNFFLRDLYFTGVRFWAIVRGLR